MTALHPSLPRNPTLSQPIASTSSLSTPSSLLCSTCRSKHAKYTCPGCTTHTCSLTCSTSHKSQTGCTGQRNKVGYVPMNEYGWGKMMDDYVFLEDMSRKVGDWGEEIVRGGYSFGNGDNKGRGRGGRRGMKGRGRGGGGGGGGGGSGRTKRDVLKLQLEARDIDMDLLPIGMERRKVNQSSWDYKNQTALLTIEFKFHKPLNPFAPSSQPREQPFILITHKNNIKSSLLTLIRSHMKMDGRNHSKKESSYPEWAKCLVSPDPDDDPESFTNPQCVMQALISHQLRGSAYYSFDPSQPLINLLRHTHFVEFPTIEIWEEFQGIIVDVQGVVRPSEDERQPKRRKLNPKAGRLAINGLLGDYGSEEEEEEQASKTLAALDDYAESGDNDDGSIGSDDEGEVEIDPAILLDLMRQTRDEMAVEDDMIDWGDYDSGQE